jgi:hypothetical protein
VLVELVPTEIKTTSVAAYFFIISNIGGNMPLVVPLLRPFFESLGYIRIDALRCKNNYCLNPQIFLISSFINKLRYKIFGYFSFLILKTEDVKQKFRKITVTKPNRTHITC